MAAGDAQGCHAVRAAVITRHRIDEQRLQLRVERIRLSHRRIIRQRHLRANGRVVELITKDVDTLGIDPVINAIRLRNGPNAITCDLV